LLEFRIFKDLTVRKEGTYRRKAQLGPGASGKWWTFQGFDYSAHSGHEVPGDQSTVFSFIGH
jgi:hypothetical protein